MTGVAFVLACVCRDLRREVGKHAGPVFLSGVVLGSLVEHLSLHGPASWESKNTV